MNYLKCDYMLRHGKGRHEAVVTGMIPAGVFVALKDIAVDGFIHISNLGWGYYEFDEKNRRCASATASSSGLRKSTLRTAACPSCSSRT